MKAPWGWFLIVPLVICCALLAATQFSFLEKSFFQELGFGLPGPAVGFDNYIAVLRSPFYRNAIETTIVVAGAATAGCIVLAYPLAYTIARMSSRWSLVLLAFILLASLVSAPIKVLGLIIIFGKESGLNQLLLWLGVVDAPVSILGIRVGVVVSLIYYSLAFAVLLLYSVIRTIPVSLEEAAAIQGCGRWRTMWRVVLPLSLPGLTTVALTVFNLGMGAFAAAALMGAGRVPTLPVVIYQTIFIETKYATASTLAMILLAMVLLVNVLSILLLARFSAPQSTAEMARRPRSRLLPERAGDALRAWRSRLPRVLASVGDRLRLARLNLHPYRNQPWLRIGRGKLLLF